jgi:hypothetical protein
VKEFSEIIEQTTRNPIRFDPKLDDQKPLISESYELKGAKLEVVLVKESCVGFGTPRLFTALQYVTSFS